MNSHYKRIIREYKNWLIVLRYSEKTIYSSNRTLTIICEYFEEIGIINFRKLKKNDVDDFVSYLVNTKSKVTKEVRSNVHINSYISLLKKLSEYLFHTYQYTLPVEHLKYLKENPKEIEILTISEVKKLFSVTNNNKVGLRDRVMLSLFYSCGLRRTEGVNINLNDIDFQRKTILIRVSKFSKKRVVPFTDSTEQILKEYLNRGRPSLMNPKKRVRKSLLLNVRGQKITSFGLEHRLKFLVKKSKITKRVTLHLLRHSIASHLLDKGMNIEDISSFLGHTSIESTQIYTHINDYR